VIASPRRNIKLTLRTPPERRILPRARQDPKSELGCRDSIEIPFVFGVYAFLAGLPPLCTANARRARAFPSWAFAERRKFGGFPLILAQKRIAEIKLNQGNRERRSIDRASLLLKSETRVSGTRSDFVLRLKGKGKREKAKFYLPICRLISANAPSDAPRRSLFDELRFHPERALFDPSSCTEFIVHAVDNTSPALSRRYPKPVPTLYLARTIVKLL